LGTLVVILGLIALVAIGSHVVDGLVVMVAGAAVIWLRSGFGDYAYAAAQRSYIWPRDPDRMKPNAELESGVMTVVAVFAGVGMIIGGIALMDSG
jgi:hypothetical protein